MKYPNPLILLAAFLYSLYFIPTASAHDAQFEVYANHIPPYSVIKQESISGFSHMVFQQLLEITQFDAHYNRVNWARSYQKLTCEPYAVMLALSRLPEREEKFHWIGKVGQLSPVVWSKKERSSEFPIIKDRDIAQYSFAEVRGFRFHRYLESLDYFPIENLQLTLNKDKAINMLLKERVDLMASDKLVLQWRFKSLGLDFTSVAPVYYFNNTKNDLYIAVSKTTPEPMVELLKTAFKQLKQTGQLSNIHQQWLSNLEPDTEPAD